MLQLQKMPVRKPLYLEPLLVIPYLISVLFAMFFPDEGIDWHWFNQFIQSMVDAVPSIKGYAKKSNFPEVSKAYFAFAPIIFSPTLYLFIRKKNTLFGRYVGFEVTYQKIIRRKFPIFFCIIAICFCTFCAAIVFIQFGYQIGPFSFNQNKTTLIFFGWFVSFGAIYFWIAGIYLYILFILKIFNNKI